jgi:hypothetical protein
LTGYGTGSFAGLGRIRADFGPARRWALALYYFHLTDGHQTLIDPDGREIADSNTISALALHEARAMICQDALAGRINFNQYIEVRDADGKLIHQLAFRDAVTISGS